MQRFSHLTQLKAMLLLLLRWTVVMLLLGLVHYSHNRIVCGFLTTHPS